MKSFFSVILFLPVIYCCAQSPGTNVPLILSNISEQNGLSDDHVKCVLKDKDGFIWIGTADGLNLVDGSTIRIYRHIESDSASLPGSDIITLTEDTINGLLYAGTDKGLCWYDKKRKLSLQLFLPQVLTDLRWMLKRSL